VLARPIEWSEAVTTVRTSTQLAALNAALGGGFAEGSSVIVSGESGSGKTSLVMQIATVMVEAILASSEQARERIQFRAREMRLCRGVPLVCSRDLKEILRAAQGKRFLGLDSLNELIGDAQENARTLTTWSRETGASVLCVAQLVSNGRIGGGSKIPYMYDTRLELIGSSIGGTERRILRTHKNRHGPEGFWALDLSADGWHDTDSGANQVAPPAPAPVPFFLMQAPPVTGERDDE